MAVFEPLFDTLNSTGVRYVVVGGLAVVLHGHARLTADVDLIVDLDAETTVRVASIPDLIHLKRLAGRPLDESDIAHLDLIQRLKEDREDG